MRCVIARYPFDLTKTEVVASMKGIRPELVTADCESVTIGRRRYPVKQVGEVITRQDRRDFTAGEITRAMKRLGFTCHERPEAAPVSGSTPLQTASALLGGSAPLQTASVPPGGPTPLQTASALLGGAGSVAV